MEIHLKTQRYCIETAAAKTYEHLLRRYFTITDAEDERQEVEAKIATLQVFLEQADMAFLRRSYRELDKGGDAEVILEWGINHQELILRFNGKTIAISLSAPS